VPDHKSKCRSPHGHHYKVEVIVGAMELQDSGSSTGMVLDFGDIKEILMIRVHDVLDHGFIAYEGDNDFLLIVQYDDGTVVNNWKLITLPYVPTAENIARWVFEEIKDDIKEIGEEHYDVWLDGVRVWETPTSTAIYQGPSEIVVERFEARSSPT
jgi:6-pyruvoyltetrahydropterin/6-carboxytetrahydropterin synthase